jgi:NTE family protein
MRVCVLPGGGAYGAYQVGVLKALTQKGYVWDGFCGVSVGAVNGAHMAQFEKEFVKSAALTLEAFWYQIKGNETLYTPWFWGPFEWLSRRSINNTAPLRSLIKSRLGPMKLPLSVGAVNLTTKKYSYFREDHPQLLDAIMASSAFPGAFPPVKIGEDYFVDGGVRDVAPIRDAIAMGATEIDCIANTPISELPSYWEKSKDFNLIDLAVRVVEIMSNEIGQNDFLPVGVKVNYFAPQQEWKADPLDFDPAKIRQRIAYGYEQTR